jgi:DNA-binding Lrp family transcriptional regulator
MVIGITLIKAMPGQERQAYSSLLEVEGIKSVHHIFGEHDFLLIIRAGSESELYRNIEGIERLGGVAEARPLLLGVEENL